MLSRALSPVDWTESAWAIHNKIRGLSPWPAASTEVISGESMKLFASHVTEERTDKRPGTVVSAGKQGIDVACGDGVVLRITQLQAAGGKRMSAADYLPGHPIA
jgi:methionyl-tRNA formyltransferase